MNPPQQLKQLRKFFRRVPSSEPGLMFQHVLTQAFQSSAALGR
jgi:hypothetical protein